MKLITIGILLAVLSYSAVAQTPEEPNDQNGEIRFISDDLFTYLRAGPSNEFRLLGSVTAGTEVRLLQVDRESGFVEIIDDRQRTGWVELKFVSRIPSIRIELQEAQSDLIEKQAKIDELNAEIEAIQVNLADSKQQKIELNRQITEHLEEVNQLNSRLEEKDKTDKMEWFTRGTILALISVNIGYIMGMFGSRKKNKERLM